MCYETDLYRLSAEESLINSHIYAPECASVALELPGLCNCFVDNGCGRLAVGQPTLAAMFDTPFTFNCANVTLLYDIM